MTAVNKIIIPNDLRKEAWDYARDIAPNFHNKFTMYGGITPKQLFVGKLSEIAAHLWFGIELNDIFVDAPDKWDIDVAGIKIDIKGSAIGHNLIWPLSKTDYDERKFEHLIAVSIDMTDSSIAFINGVISKELFRERKFIAVQDEPPFLTGGTWYMPKGMLYQLAGDTPEVRISYLKRQIENMIAAPPIYRCHCGQIAHYGIGVHLLKGEEGQWFCSQHRPVATPAC